MILFIAPLPPPITGQNWASAEILRTLQAYRIDCRIINTSSGHLPLSLNRFLYFIKLILAIFKLLFSFPRRHQTMYVSLNANRGMVFSAVYAAIARLYRYRLFIHHHTASHINEERSAMRWLSRFAGREATHICQCRAMGDELARRYTAIGRVVTLSNAAFIVRPPSPAETPSRRAFTLGHLSNLSRAKGLHHVLQLFDALLERGADVELLIAGPCAEPAAETLLAAAQARHPERIRHLGPVRDQAKIAFFDVIDAFLFPSEYANETQGIVNLEALAQDVPVIAYGRCCIPDDLRDAGLVIPPDADFVERALPYVLELCRRPAAARAARAGARRRFDELAAAGRAQLQDFLESLQPSARNISPSIRA